MDERWKAAIDALVAARNTALEMGGAQAVQRVHQRGKHTARERLESLLDRGSFQEVGLLAEGRVQHTDGSETSVPADAVVCGWGKIAGRQVCVVADDGSMMGGAASIMNVEKRFRMRRLAISRGCPFIGLYEGSAIRFQDSMDAGIMARIPAFKEVVDCAGEIPQVAAIMGASFGRPPMDVLFSDFSLQVEGTGFLGLSGPPLVAGGIGESVDVETLAGTGMHADTTGLIDRAVESEEACLAAIRAFLTYMPQNCRQLPARAHTDGDPHQPCPELLDIVPSDLRRPYDMAEVIGVLADDASVFEFKPTFGVSFITCLARIGGMPVGLVASQPKRKGGVIDGDACMKGRRFVAVCNAFHIPLVFLQDQPGFMIGQQAERERVLYWAGGLMATVQRATVPKITVILRKSHGAAVWGMGGQSTQGDLVVAWPLAIMTGTGPASAVNTIHARELAGAADEDALRQRLEAHYNATGSALRAAASFGIDDVIHPAETRQYLLTALESAQESLSQQLGPKPPLFP